MVSLNLLLEQEWFSNMKMGKKPTLLVLSFTAVASISASVGYGAWITGDMLEREGEIDISKSSRIPVAYIGDTKYFTLDAALDAAYGNGKKDNIYVIPDLGMDLTISKDHEIEKGDSFLLPYEGENILDESGNAGTGFADNNPTKFRKTHVILDAEKKLDIKGNMSIGAITGSVSNPQGQASSSYCELTLGMNSTLNVEGKLNCYGFIKEGRSGSNILVKDGGVLTTTISFYDYTSGSSIMGMMMNDVFPFKQFDIPSIRPKMIFDYGSSLIGAAHLYGNNVGNKGGTATIIGKSDAFINVETAGSKIEWQFSDTETDKTTNSNNAKDEHKTSIVFSGTGSFGSIVATLKDNEGNATSLDSKNYYLPVPCGYDITLKQDSNFNSPSAIKGVKFMPGSSLTVEENANLSFNSNVLFYQSTTSADDNRKFDYPTSEPAIFKNNGTTKINAGFEGVVSTLDNSSISNASSISFGYFYDTIDDCKEKTGVDAEKNSVYSKYYWGGSTGKIYKEDGASELTAFEKGWAYEMSTNNDGWLKIKELDMDISKVSISYLRSREEYVVDSDGIGGYEEKTEVIRSSFPEEEGIFLLTATPLPEGHGSTELKYTWKADQNGDFYNGYGDSRTKIGKEFVTTEPKAILITDKNSGSSDLYCNVTVTVNFKKADGTGDGESVISDKLDFTAKAGSSCLPPTAKVLMADGTYKRAVEIRTGDIVISFNHETGKFESNKVIGNDHLNQPAQNYNVVHLEFANGKSTDFIKEHGYFDTTLNQYVYLHSDDASNYIGHKFIFYENGNMTTSKLSKVTQSTLYTTLVSPATANHLNFIADDMLTIGGGLNGLFNIFEYDPNTLAFDKEKMQMDIDAFGLLGYESFEKYFPKEIYDLLPCKYLNVSIGKGLITWDVFEGYVNTWKDQLLENI